MDNKLEKCIVRPLVLLSVVDHFERCGKSGNKRVAGVILGSKNKDGVLEITNCYGVPFEEDLKDDSVWFFDNKYHDKMYEMFLKVNAREKAVGWYSSGPKLRRSDVEITKMFRKYCPEPVLLVTAAPSVKKSGGDAPLETFCLADPTGECEDGKTFNNLVTIVSATNPEEIGIEQMLRDIRDKTISSLSEKLEGKNSSLKKFGESIEIIQKYLSLVESEQIPKNNRITFLLQEIFNDSLMMQKDNDFVESYSLKSNDSALILYLSALTRSVVSFSDLVDNRIDNRKEAEKLRQEERKKNRKSSEHKNDEKKQNEKTDEKKDDSDETLGSDEEYSMTDDFDGMVDDE